MLFFELRFINTFSISLILSTFAALKNAKYATNPNIITSKVKTRCEKKSASKNCISFILIETAQQDKTGSTKNFEIPKFKATSFFISLKFKISASA